MHMSSNAPQDSDNTAMINPFTVREHWAEWRTGRITVKLIECGPFADEYRVYWNGILRYKGRGRIGFAEAAKVYEDVASEAARHDGRGAAEDDGGAAELEATLAALPNVTLTEADYAEGERRALRWVR